MRVETVPESCPLCRGDLKGNEKYQFYCKKCNMLFAAATIKKQALSEDSKIGISMKQPAPSHKPKHEPISLKYIGSSLANKYHIPGCRYTKQINDSNIIYFSSKEEAEKKQYLPCICARNK